MRCGQLILRDYLGFAMVCRNEASVIATDHKHGQDEGYCIRCIDEATADDPTFIERHSFREPA